MTCPKRATTRSSSPSARHVEIELDRPTLPEFPVPEEFVVDRTRSRRPPISPTSRRAAPSSATARRCRQRSATRLDYELGVITKMGFPAYFLVVGDLIRHARAQRIRVGPGPGLGRGLPVAYCLRIADIDPIRYGLLFERFLNPGRMSDARHRHGLRRAPPRRDDPLRHGALRRGPRRADRDLLHDQGQGGGEGRGARPRATPTRSATR